MREEDAAGKFARTVVNTSYEAIPKEAAEVTKKCILDTLGTIAAASSAGQGCKELVKLVKEGAGKRQSTIIAFGGKVPCWMAAFANGAMAHALDYDDHLVSAGIHPSCTTVPAAFAIAGRVGRVSGKDLITAVTLGNDMICRLGLAVRSRSEKWMLSSPMGCFSAAAVAGKLLGLDEDRMISAFGIALSQGCGAREMAYGVGSELRGMYPAFPNKAGVLSALMAQNGIRGPRNSLESRGGFFQVFADGEYDRACLLADLGQRFEGAGMSFKPWPSCGRNHPYIEATLKIVAEQDLHPEDIAEITAFVNRFAQQQCEPLEARRKPATSMDAKYSIPFVIATAVARRKVLIKDFTDKGIKDPLVLQIAQKVTARVDPQLFTEKGVSPGMVEIRTGDGKVFAKRIDVAYGHPANPISMESLIEKFRDCVSYSVKRLPEPNIDKVITMAKNLEDVEDVSQIVELLA